MQAPPFLNSTKHKSQNYTNLKIHAKQNKITVPSNKIIYFEVNSKNMEILQTR